MTLLRTSAIALLVCLSTACRREVSDVPLPASTASVTLHQPAPTGPSPVTGTAPASSLTPVEPLFTAQSLDDATDAKPRRLSIGLDLYSAPEVVPAFGRGLYLSDDGTTFLRFSLPLGGISVQTSSMNSSLETMTGRIASVI